MVDRWVRERKSDAFYKMAKRSGYRSRATFKLKQISARYGLLRKGFVVVDLGAAPGGWSQAALEFVGPSGAVVGVDLVRVAPLPPARFIRGDMTRRETLRSIKEEIRRALALPPDAPTPGVDAVISDMSPNISGVYSVDQARSLVLASKALGAARGLLRPGGNFCTKVFEGEDFAGILKEVEGSFAFVKVHAPIASRKASSEVYIIAKGFRGGKRKARIQEEG